MLAHSSDHNQPNLDTVEQQIRTAMAHDDWALVAELEVEFGRLEQPTRPFLIISAALWYASVGLPVFPLQPQMKMPHKGTRGLKEATTDPDVIRAWWDRWTESNVAIATGHQVDVIDIDGPEGVVSWARMRNLPPILGVVSTPRPGGNHLYVPANGKGNKAAMAPGVDYRGLGGYVVAAPSQTVELRDNNGKIKQYAGTYVWRRPLQLEAVNAE